MSTKNDEPELLGLIRDYENDMLRPVHVELGSLAAAGSRMDDFRGRPVFITEAMHTVAEDIRLLLGLRLAVSEDRPLPYSTSSAPSVAGCGATRRRAGCCGTSSGSRSSRSPGS